MPDEMPTPSPYDPTRRVGTGLAGETTRSEGGGTLPGTSRGPLEVIGDFEILGRLGQGGMGTVYRARQVSLDRQVALKILPSQFEQDPDYVTRFQREARMASSLTHANLVKVYAAGVSDGCHYIAMELVEGETLADWLRRGAMPARDALRIILEVARALEYGWSRAQLIHRDIKPGNIFLSADGSVKVGDLGLAKTIGSGTTGLTQVGTAMGTPHYISPEQARGDADIDFRADIYSLGCTFYQMLTGQTVYGGSDPMAVMSLQRDAPPPAILKVLPKCPLPLARMVSKMLKKQRRERFATYDELIAAIEQVRAELDPALAVPAGLSIPPATKAGQFATPPPAPIPPLAAPAPPKSKALLYAGLALLAVWVAAFLFWPRPSKLTRAELYAREHAGETPAPHPASLLAAASKEAPFENTLGMKFIPVPIMGGPSAGTDVLVGIWDTRVRDYELFARDKERYWPKPDLVQSSEDPAVNVSWDDAQLFCEWLTAREQTVGRLPAEWRYRLPSDHEWSCAVGIGFKEDPAKLPKDKSERIDNVFPWGATWPPPAKVGNYADASAELAKLQAAGRYLDFKVIPDYHDGFAGTSPVATFPANRLGLYDMGGNVWQWCEDLFDRDQKDRVMRGAAWDTSTRSFLLSSERHHQPPGYRYRTLGFRCVLSREPGGAIKGAPRADAARKAAEWVLGLGGYVDVQSAAGHATVKRPADLPFGPFSLVRVDFQPQTQQQRDRVTDSGLALLTEQTGLESLKVLNAPITDQGLSILKNFPKLDFLDFSGCPKVTGGILSYLEGAPQLRVLRLNSVEAADLRKLREFHAFEELGIDRVALTSELCAALGELTGLRGLEARSCPTIPGDILRYLKNLPHLTNLQLVNGAPLRDEDMADLGQFKGLTTLSLPNGIGDPTLREVAKLPELTELQWGAANITDEGFQSLNALQKLTTLTIGRCKVTDAGLASLKALPKLASLTITGKIAVTPTGLADLKKARPALKITVAPTAESWQDVLRDPAQLVLSGNVARVLEGLRFTGVGQATLHQGPRHNAAIRMRTVYSNVKVQLHARQAGNGLYQLYITGTKTLILARWDNAARQTIRLAAHELRVPLKPGEEYSLEFRVEGETVNFKFNGETVGSVHDDALIEGAFGFGVPTAGPSGADPVLVKSVEILDLDN